MGCLSWILEGKEPTNEESMITDEQLDERAKELTDKRYSWWRGFHIATRAALEVDRESLKLLEMCRDTQIVSASLDAHIDTLRKRLGLTP